MATADSIEFLRSNGWKEVEHHQDAASFGNESLVLARDELLLRIAVAAARRLG